MPADDKTQAEVSKTEEAKSEGQEAQSDITNQEPERIDFPDGQTLGSNELYKISSHEKIKQIVFAGTSNSGKTTLIAAIYSLFHEGPVGEYNFAGSQTLPAFEQRVYHIRLRSNTGKTEMPRTQVGTSDILHLQLRNTSTHNSINLILYDVPGEDIESAATDVDFLKEEMPFIKNVDELVIIIDGEKYSKKETQASAMQFAYEFSQSVNNAHLLSEKVHIQLLLSKDDYLVGGQGTISDESMKPLTNASLTLEKITGTKITVEHAAAMPPASYSWKEDAKKGLKQLLENWLKPMEKENTDGINSVIAGQNPLSQYNNYAMTREG
jgi:GTPase SAR1 family protein